MKTLVSGTLVDPSGNIIPNAQIVLNAISTAFVVLSGAAVDAVAADVSNLTETIDDDDNSVNAMGGFIDLTGQLALYFNQLGQVVLGENNVNVNESLKTLFANINSNLNSINAILTRILFLSQEDTDALWGVMDNANMSPIYLTTDGYVIINTINVFSEISSILSRFSNYDALYFSSDEYVQKGGMMSDDGKLLFYFNDNEELILGDGDLNVTQFIKKWWNF